MRLKFIMLILLATILVSAGMLVLYGIQNALQMRLNSHASYPIFVYVQDSTYVSLLRTELAQYSSIETISSENGKEAAFDLVQTNDLAISAEQIERYYFPDIVSIQFKPGMASIQERKLTLKTLEHSKHADDIEAHDAVIMQLESEINILTKAKLYANIIFFVISLLILFLGKLCLELRILLQHKLNPYSIVDKIRYQERIRNQSIILSIIPVLLSIALYYLLGSLGKLHFILSWDIFAFQFAASIIAGLGSYLLVMSRAYQAVNEPEIIVGTHVEPSAISTPRETDDEPKYTE